MRIFKGQFGKQFISIGILFDHFQDYRIFWN